MRYWSGALYELYATTATSASKPPASAGKTAAMSKMPEYDATAGFPQVHVEAFQRVACQHKMVISSRELNPLCTDLVLEGYAAKGFHIKAKTCTRSSS